MSEPRRKAIAEIARRHNVLLIEDDIYGVLIRQEAPMLAAFAPERTFVVSGLSKAVTAGLRVWWAACPPHMAARVKVAHKMLTGGTALPPCRGDGAPRSVRRSRADPHRCHCRTRRARADRPRNFGRPILPLFPASALSLAQPAGNPGCPARSRRQPSTPACWSMTRTSSRRAGREDAPQGALRLHQPPARGRPFAASSRCAACWRAA